MQLTPAQEQLKKLNIQAIMGKSGQDDAFAEKLRDLTETIWSNFLNEKVAYMLSEKDQDKLADLILEKDTTKEQFMDFFRGAIDDFDHKYMVYLLENKKQSVVGRIQYLEVMASDQPEKVELLKTASKAVENEDWAQVENILVNDFRDFV